jgi:predicted metal-binding membrane protein
LTATAAIEAFARKERLAVLLALGLVVIISARLMLRSGDALMAMPYDWTPLWLALLFAMWWTMMMAMMLPSAAPSILTFAAISRRLDGANSPSRLIAFVMGYLLVWTGFSLAAVCIQLASTRIMPLDMMMATTSRVAGGVLLIAAGIYQMTPLKEACLHKCQMPLMVLARNWRPGLVGALRMGLGHGLFCVGCCAVLMAVLFYGGVMEPTWVAGLALYVLAEKIIPRNWYVNRFAGFILCAWGATILIRSFA